MTRSLVGYEENDGTGWNVPGNLDAEGFSINGVPIVPGGGVTSVNGLTGIVVLTIGNPVVSTVADVAATYGQVILADATGGPITVTLPAPAAGTHETNFVKKIDASGNAVTVVSASGLIDGAASQTLTTQYNSFQYATNGTNWFTL